MQEFLSRDEKWDERRKNNRVKTDEEQRAAMNKINITGENNREIQTKWSAGTNFEMTWTNLRIFCVILKGCIYNITTYLLDMHKFSEIPIGKQVLHLQEILNLTDEPTEPENIKTNREFRKLNYGDHKWVNKHQSMDG